MTALALCAYWLAVYGVPAIVRILAIVALVCAARAVWKAV